MLGANPGCFKNVAAAKLAGKAYFMETTKKQVLLKKSGYYSVCESGDVGQAESEGYEVVEYL